jgi:tRNA dimethylallyltransferase
VSIPDAIALLGPTASGKSAISMALAERFDLEIISVDSALVYRGMDIGTAKPDAADLRRVPHHLIDLIDPIDAYSAARFAEDATRAISEVRARKRLPLLVGGTMLYLRALRSGLDALPRADASVRASIDARAAMLGWPALHAELAAIDPVTAARLEPGDAQRIQRALEVHAITGQPLSSLIGQTDRSAADARPQIALIALEPSDRAVLHQRIAARFDTMLRHGLVDEVRALRARGDLHANLPSMRCVGYRQSWQYLDDIEPHPGDAKGVSTVGKRADQRVGNQALGTVQAGSVEAAVRWQRLVDEGVAATRQLAKRQLTWLRSMPDRHVVDCLAPDALQQVSALIETLGVSACRSLNPAT